LRRVITAASLDRMVATRVRSIFQDRSLSVRLAPALILLHALRVVFATRRIRRIQRLERNAPYPVQNNSENNECHTGNRELYDRSVVQGRDWNQGDQAQVDAKDNNPEQANKTRVTMRIRKGTDTPCHESTYICQNSSASKPTLATTKRVPDRRSN